MLFFCVVVVFYGTPESVRYSSPFLMVKYLRNSPDCATMAGTVHTQPVFVCVNECVDALIYFCLWICTSLSMHVNSGGTDWLTFMTVPSAMRRVTGRNAQRYHSRPHSPPPPPQPHLPWQLMVQVSLAPFLDITSARRTAWLAHTCTNSPSIMRHWTLQA